MTGFAYAQAAPGAFDMLNSLLVPTMLIIGIMYFLMIRPQQRRLKEHRDMVASIRRGDTVVTSGGIVGKVTKVEDQRTSGRDRRQRAASRSCAQPSPKCAARGRRAPAGKAKAASG